MTRFYMNKIAGAAIVIDAEEAILLE